MKNGIPTKVRQMALFARPMVMDACCPCTTYGILYVMVPITSVP